MSKRVLTLMLILSLLPILPASAELVSLPAIPATLQLPDGEYSPILTQENLAQNEGFIMQHGGSLASWQEEWKAQGILMKAYNDEESRVLVVTAQADAEGQRYVDIDQHTPAIRADYRREYLNKEGYFAALGYRMESAEWKDFPVVGRFLMMKYRFSPGGTLQHRGFARRSVKNGLSVMVDLQVWGRGLKGTDNNALNEVFDSLVFTAAAAPGVSLPVVLSETSAPPAETNQAAFSLEGSTKPGVALNLVVGSFTGGSADVYNAIADQKGNYRIDVTLPREDSFFLTLTASAEGLETLERGYPVLYNKMLIPVAFTSPEFPRQLVNDNYTISGKTDSGVTVQLVNGDKSTSQRTGRAGTFSFKVNTKDEGTYNLRLTVSKSGSTPRDFSFKGTRGAVVAASAGSATAAPVSVVPVGSITDPVSPSYTDLIARTEEYIGSILTYDGHLMETEVLRSEVLLHVATRKGIAGYADTIILTSDRDPAIRPDTPIRVVGELLGLNQAQEGDISAGYPRLRLVQINAFPAEALPSAQP